MTDSNFIASIDVGSRKIVVLLADEENGRFTVTGYAIGESAGVKKGVIEKIESEFNQIIESI